MTWSPPSRRPISLRMTKAIVTAGLKWAPDIGPSARIITNRMPPVASAGGSRTPGTSAASRDPMIPDPTTVASRNAVPAASANTRRVQFDRMPLPSRPTVADTGRTRAEPVVRLAAANCLCWRPQRNPRFHESRNHTRRHSCSRELSRTPARSPAMVAGMRHPIESGYPALRKPCPPMSAIPLP